MLDAPDHQRAAAPSTSRRPGPSRTTHRCRSPSGPIPDRPGAPAPARLNTELGPWVGLVSGCNWTLSGAEPRRDRKAPCGAPGTPRRASSSANRSFFPSTSTLPAARSTPQPIDKAFALRTDLVEAHRKGHRRGWVRRSIHLRVREPPALTRLLVQRGLAARGGSVFLHRPDHQVPRPRPDLNRRPRPEDGIRMGAVADKAVTVVAEAIEGVAARRVLGAVDGHTTWCLTPQGVTAPERVFARRVVPVGATLTFIKANAPRVSWVRNHDTRETTAFAGMAVPGTRHAAGFRSRGHSSHGAERPCIWEAVRCDGAPSGGLIGVVRGCSGAVRADQSSNSFSTARSWA